MLAFNSNRWFWCLGMLTIVLINTICRANLSPGQETPTADENDNYQDDMTRAIKIVWAGHKYERAGFERTQQALITILNELTAPDVRKMELPEALLDAKRLASIYLDVCELSRPKCDLVFEQLDKIKREHVLEDSINQLPFLEVCERAHKRFCDQLGSNDNAKKRVWNDIKKEVAREEKRASSLSDASDTTKTDKKISFWPKSWQKKIDL